MLLIALLPDVEERPRYPEKPASLADVAADALRMLQHAQPGLHLPCLDLLVNWIFIPNLLRWAGRIPHLSGMSISSYRDVLSRSLAGVEIYST